MHKKTIRSIPLFLKTPQKQGLAPGTMVHIGRKKMEECVITEMIYDKASCSERTCEPKDISVALPEGSVRWIDVNGIHDTEKIAALGERFALHSLTLEDVVNTAQRPKLEDFEEYLLVVVKMLYHDQATDSPKIEHISLMLTQDTVITLQETSVDVFDHIRLRIRDGKGPMRDKRADYLFYRILDAIVDEYFIVLGSLGERVEEIERDLLDRTDDKALLDIHELRRELVFARQSILPLRDLLMRLNPEDSPFLGEDMLPYLRDLYDHASQASVSVETFQDMTSNLFDNYLSIVNNKMNAVMKVLTVITSIFIPLTFVAGVYGMNFKHMPELNWVFGYPFVLLIMACMTAGMLLWLRKKKWI